MQRNDIPQADNQLTKMQDKWVIIKEEPRIKLEPQCSEPGGEDLIYWGYIHKAGQIDIATCFEFLSELLLLMYQCTCTVIWETEKNGT